MPAALLAAGPAATPVATAVKTDGAQCNASAPAPKLRPGPRARAASAARSTAGGGGLPGNMFRPEGDGHNVGGARVVDELSESGEPDVESALAVAANVLPENGDTWLLFGVAGERHDTSTP